jgi:hypothetical protein
MYKINSIESISFVLACLMASLTGKVFATPDISHDLPGSTFISTVTDNSEGSMVFEPGEGEVVRDPAFGMSEQSCEDVENAEGCSDLAMHPSRARLHF